MALRVQKARLDPTMHLDSWDYGKGHLLDRALLNELATLPFLWSSKGNRPAPGPNRGSPRKGRALAMTRLSGPRSREDARWQTAVAIGAALDRRQAPVSCPSTSQERTCRQQSALWATLTACDARLSAAVLKLAGSARSADQRSVHLRPIATVSYAVSSG